ncbi:MAG: flavodoxin family protein [Candidatus Heimdallarchaeaceae archaeon]
MVKAIVLYNSKGGNTKKVAEKIAEGLEADISNNKNIPDLSEYDLVATGSWMIMGRISFAGARYLKKLKRKGIDGKKVALFFTSGGPEEPHWRTENQEKPKILKDIMFETMEKILTRNKQVKILPERYYCKGAVRMMGKVKENEGHPTDEDLERAREFGAQLKDQL